MGNLRQKRKNYDRFLTFKCAGRMTYCFQILMHKPLVNFCLRVVYSNYPIIIRPCLNYHIVLENIVSDFERLIDAKGMFQSLGYN